MDKRPPEYTIPEPWSGLVDDVTAQDRLMFETNPGLEYYRRPYVPGEFFPAFPSNILAVEVINHRPGVRTRLAIVLPREYLN